MHEKRLSPIENSLTTKSHQQRRNSNGRRHGVDDVLLALLVIFSLMLKLKKDVKDVFKLVKVFFDFPESTHREPKNDFDR